MKWQKRVWLYADAVVPEWLLVETLGDEPEVVAQGRQIKKFVPLAAFLRRNPNLGSIRRAVADTVAAGSGLVRDAEQNHRIIRTEPVVMTDGRVHAVHVWCGPPDCEPPERPVPGPAKWDLTALEPTLTVAALVNFGMDSSIDPTQFEKIAELFPPLEFGPDELEILSTLVGPENGRTLATTWEFIDSNGKFRRLGVVGRNVVETVADGSEHVFGRGVNLVVEVLDTRPEKGDFAKRVITGFAQPGSYRCFMNPEDLRLLKWLDEPCPLFNWRRPMPIHPDDEEAGATLLEELKDGTASAVLRLPGNDGGWVPLHVTISPIELDRGMQAGLATFRRPTDDELADIGLSR